MSIAPSTSLTRPARSDVSASADAPTRSLRPLLDLRQALDTRSMRIVLIPVLGLLIGFGALVAFAQPALLQGAAVSFDATLLVLSLLLMVALPVPVILAVAGEWANGSIQSTILQRPHRGSVLASKAIAGTVLGIGIAVLAIATAAGMTWGAGAVTGAGSSFEGAGAAIRGSGVQMLVTVLLAVAFAVLTQSVVIALLVAVALPFLVSMLASVAGALGSTAAADAIAWLHISQAAAALSSGEVTASALGAVGLLIVLPLLLGVPRWLRREIG